MAKKSVKRVNKAKPAKADAPLHVEDAVEVSEISDAIETPDTAEESIVDASVEPEVPEVSVEPEADADVTPDGDPIDAGPQPEPITQDPAPKRSGVLPLLLGGVAAAALGFLAARADLIDKVLPPSMRAGAEQSALADDLAAANAQIAKLQSDIQDLGAKFETQSAPDAKLGDDLQTLIAEQNDRIAALEERPTGTGGASSGNFDAEFAELQAMASAQQAEIDKLLADARLVEKSTEDAANSTLARAAATRIIAAIESGNPFDAALGDLAQTGIVDIPAELSDAAATGVAPLAVLQSEIPDVARAALAASRSADTESAGGFSSFLQRSLGARSVEPREGTDPDAVLSRVEDATRNGRLTDAIAEAETLPAEGQAAMADWLSSARTRQSVMSASETLMQRLAAN